MKTIWLLAVCAALVGCVSIEELSNQITVLEKENSDLKINKGRAEELSKQIAVLEKKNSDLEINKGRAEELSKQIAVLEKKNSDLANDVRIDIKIIDDLQIKNAELQGKFDDLQIKNAELQGKFDDLQIKNAELQGEKDATNEVGKLRQQITELRGEKETLEKEATNEVGKLKQQIMTLEYKLRIRNDR
ncbi:MAG: hypothetical protein LBP76_07205 [Treponema sp.]|jgi:chromosome segregation ATPase|nr:hypothetical protein [Treponema sp.]